MHADRGPDVWPPAIIWKLLQGPQGFRSRQRAHQREHQSQSRARRAPRPARLADSTSETRTEVRASERQQKWVNGPYSCGARQTDPYGMTAHIHSFLRADVQIDVRSEHLLIDRLQLFCSRLLRVPVWPCDKKRRGFPRRCEPLIARLENKQLISSSTVYSAYSCIQV